MGSTTWIGFSTPRRFNPVSYGIRKFTGSEVSHAWFCYFDRDFKLPMVMDAHETGFRLISLKNFKAKNRIVAVANSPWDLTAGLAFLAGRLGTHYDFKAALGIFLMRLFRMAKNPFQSAEWLVCTESIVRALEASGVETGLDPEAISAGDLMRYFDALHLLQDEDAMVWSESQ